MDTQTWYFQKWLLCTPVSTFKCLLLLSCSDNHFSCKAKWSVKPCSPDTSTIGHHINLPVSKSFFLTDWCNLKNRRICVASNDFERVDRFFANLVSSEKGANCRSITGEIISFTSLQFPGIYFFDLSEAVLGKLIFAIVNRMEMWLSSVEAFKDLFRVRNCLAKESFGYCLGRCRSLNHNLNFYTIDTNKITTD